ncbi:hypothetical protein GIY30_11315 [Gordonia sp. HNM0687]|uniref:Peptidase C30 domain-containing protein n=1 Tax=Gordonia mangrovi TaxID=2665643 RepID=A0A6L7GTV7_9ACTN|nr:hypothetical protein [Gordonia mangrovi]MXP21938.1 hypothetical protein [Gordonia mangrovi]UVF76300.1 hypothetical protein NWF22_12925 [Gordonia mangrovi]
MARTRSRFASVVVAVAIAAAGTLGLATATAADAAAATEHRLTQCIGLSPNIVDIPFLPNRAIVAQYAGKTYIAVDFTSYWIGVGYRSDARLDWHNLRTGKHGVLRSTTHISPPYQGVHNFVIDTAAIGRGNVAITLGATNSNALWSIPAISCSGTIVVR